MSALSLMCVGTISGSVLFPNIVPGLCSVRAARSKRSERSDFSMFLVRVQLWHSPHQSLLISQVLVKLHIFVYLQIYVHIHVATLRLSIPNRTILGISHRLPVHLLLANKWGLGARKRGSKKTSGINGKKVTRVLRGIGCEPLKGKFRSYQLEAGVPGSLNGTVADI